MTTLRCTPAARDLIHAELSRQGLQEPSSGLRIAKNPATGGLLMQVVPSPEPGDRLAAATDCRV